jgi:hypothetical protein
MTECRSKLVGFARFSPEDRRKLASKAGKASQASGKAFRWTRAQAAAAGKKG